MWPLLKSIFLVAQRDRGLRSMLGVAGLLQISLLLWLTLGLEAAEGCQTTCGDVEIPYPFGIGSTHCYLDEWFEVICNKSSSSHPPKPSLKRLKLEILNVSLDPTTIRVNNPVLIYRNCPGKLPWNGIELLEGGPFSFSETQTRFTAVGCSVLASIRQKDGTVIGGCMSFCKEKAARSEAVAGCYGSECCQTEVPPGIRTIGAHISSYYNGTAADEQETCAYAFMVEQGWFTQVQGPQIVKDRGYAPAVLDWRIYNATCDSARGSAYVNLNASLSFCGPHAICSSYDRNSSLTCTCGRGYEGNPYQGCRESEAERIRNGTSPCWDGTRSCIDPPTSWSVGIPGIVVASVGTLFLVLCAWWLYRVLKRRRKTKYKKQCFKRNGGLFLQQQLSSSEGNIDKIKLFTAKELDKATDGYNENRVLGKGGQGTVYKGMLIDGKIVAVKKLNIVGEGQLEQFINEIVLLSQISHRHVVKLLGCCLETKVPLLVYEFIPNGTLSEHIHHQNEEFSLTWEMRLRIAAEVAGALSYLHSTASIPIYHRDIKSTNILLDDKYRAKVADFGTSKSFAIDQTHLTTKVQGTFGYMDPEYFQSSQFTEKSDVYSFGIVLVELLSGKRPILSTTSREGRSLATYFISSIEEDRLSEVLDAQVVKEGGKEEITAVALLAKGCINLNGKKRPTMMQVAMELERIRKGQGDFSAQEEAECHTIELTGLWDAGSSSNTYASTSSDISPLLSEKSL